MKTERFFYFLCFAMFILFTSQTGHVQRVVDWLHFKTGSNTDNGDLWKVKTYNTAGTDSLQINDITLSTAFKVPYGHNWVTTGNSSAQWQYSGIRNTDGYPPHTQALLYVDINDNNLLKAYEKGVPGKAVYLGADTADIRYIAHTEDGVTPQPLEIVGGMTTTGRMQIRVTDTIFFGDGRTSGDWRFRINGSGNLVFENYNGATWTVKSTIAK